MGNTLVDGDEFVFADVPRRGAELFDSILEQSSSTPSVNDSSFGSPQDALVLVVKVVVVRDVLGVDTFLPLFKLLCREAKDDAEEKDLPPVFLWLLVP